LPTLSKFNDRRNSLLPDERTAPELYCRGRVNK